VIADDLDCSCFACPQAGPTEPLLDLVVVGHAAQTVRAFVDRYASELKRDGCGLISLLTSLACLEQTFDTVWDPAFGGIFAALMNGKDDPAHRAAALALRLHQCGYPGDWEVPLRYPTYLRFDRWLLPSATAVQVSATTEMITIRTWNAGASSEAVFRRGDSGWHGTGGIPLPVIARGTSAFVVLTAEALQTWEFEGLTKSIDRQNPDPLVRGSQMAIELIQEYAPTYVFWVNKVVRYFVPWLAVPDQFPSGSSSTNCAHGVIGIGNHDHHLALADTLVHEASHQYFYVTSTLGAIDDGTDSTLYHNPFLEMKRPIDRILLAYHAFGNILLFWRNVRAHGLSADTYILNRERQLVQGLSILEQALDTTRALTPLGCALWEPLYEHVHSGT
jgi:HEXXH motif-containing protein